MHGTCVRDVQYIVGSWGFGNHLCLGAEVLGADVDNAAGVLRRAQVNIILSSSDREATQHQPPAQKDQ